MDKRNKELVSLLLRASRLALEARQSLIDERDNKSGLTKLNNAVKHVNILWEARPPRSNVIKFPNSKPRLQTTKRKPSERCTKKT